MLGSNFSEIEEFGLSIMRKYILSLPNDNIKGIVLEELKTWDKRSNKIELSKTEEL